MDRSASRLLWLHRSGEIEHRRFVDTLSILRKGDLLVVNNTRVSAVRLLGRKATGGAVEALLLRDLGECRYLSLVKPGKRLKPGTGIHFGDGLEARVLQDLDEGQKILEFSPLIDLRARLDQQGLVPLPPYIHAALLDRERYQTVFGEEKGSAAAPTAGLHFTKDLLSRLDRQGVQIGEVTLHVGIDTFRPVQSENLDKHRMHGERCLLSASTAKMVNQTKGRIVAVGTTTVRTLESFGVGNRQVEPGEKESKLFIRPGYRFQVIDGMFTNFHLPKTTMLMMISALAGQSNVFRAYEEAQLERYRLLSFGDSMLIL